MIEIVRTCINIKIFSSDIPARLYLNSEYVGSLDRYDMKSFPLVGDSYIWALWRDGYRYVVLPSVDSYYCEIKSSIFYPHENNLYSLHEFVSGTLGILIAVFIFLLWYGI